MKITLPFIILALVTTVCLVTLYWYQESGGACEEQVPKFNHISACPYSKIDNEFSHCGVYHGDGLWTYCRTIGIDGWLHWPDGECGWPGCPEYKGNKLAPTMAV